MSQTQKEQPNFTKARLQQVLEYCERSFVEQIGGGFNSQLESVLSTLKSLSGDAKTYQEKQFYNEIYFTLLNGRSDMSVDFKIHLKKYFKERIQSQLSENDVNVKKKSVAFNELSLISDDEENKYISETSFKKQLNEQLGDELNSLSLRVESMLGTEKNPFSPDILAKALTTTLAKVIKDNQAQSQIIKAFAEVWPEHIRTTYQGINNYLVANDVIPDIKSHISKNNLKKKSEESVHNQAQQPESPSEYTPYYMQTGGFPAPKLDLPSLPGSSSNNHMQGVLIDNPDKFKNLGLELPFGKKIVKEEVRDSLNPPTIPGFEHFAPIDYSKQRMPTSEDFERDEEVEGLRASEYDTPAQKTAKWHQAKEIIANKFGKLLGKVKSVTPIKDSIIGTESHINPATLPPGYVTVPPYQQRPSSYHKFINEAVAAQREAQRNGAIFHIPEGLTIEQLEVHSKLLVPRELSVMLNDDVVKKSFTGYQQEFRAMNMSNALNMKNVDGVTSMITPPRNVLAEIAQASVQNHKMDPNETMIVDLLSLVFEKIFSHKNLPEHIKYLISKLQIPILKTSLLDKTFFIYRDNPVRLFLDCLATHETLYNLEYHNKFETIIDDLLNKEEITQEHFAQALDVIQIMLREYSSKEGVFIKNVSASISLEERASENYDYVLKHVEKLLKRTSYTPVISFIENIWSKAFAEKWTTEDSLDKEDFITGLSLQGKISLNQSLLVFEMIVWSTEVHVKSIESREKLKTYIPKIAEGLRAITKDLNIAEEDYEKLSLLLAQQQLDFISDIKDRTQEEQQEVMKNETQAASDFAAKIEPLRKIKAASQDINKLESDFDSVFISGRWFEFNHDKSKMRLVWVSPQKTMFLFNNPAKKKVYKFDKSRVWSYYRSSHIKMVSSEQEMFGSEKLIDEAVNGKEKSFKDFNL